MEPRPAFDQVRSLPLQVPPKDTYSSGNARSGYIPVREPWRPRRNGHESSLLSQMPQCTRSHHANVSSSESIGTPMSSSTICGFPPFSRRTPRSAAGAARGRQYTARILIAAPVGCSGWFGRNRCSAGEDSADPVLTRPATRPDRTRARPPSRISGSVPWTHSHHSSPGRTGRPATPGRGQPPTERFGPSGPTRRGPRRSPCRASCSLVSMAGVTRPVRSSSMARPCHA